MRELTTSARGRLQRHRDRVSTAKAKLKAEQAARNDEIQTALRNGDGVEREIAAASGVSRSRVSQLRRAIGL